MTRPVLEYLYCLSLKSHFTLTFMTRNTTATPDAIRPDAVSPDAAPTRTNGAATAKALTPDSINDAIQKLQNLADVQIKLRKERSSIESLDLLQKMLDGELLSDDELTTVKASLKGLSKYAALHNSYKACLEDAQAARDLIDQIIGSPFASKNSKKDE